jgi:hypothetical protein
MRRTLVIGIISALFFVACSTSLWADIGFDLNDCANRATEIFVADQDGERVKVVENWLGDLKPGTVIELPGLSSKSEKTTNYEHEAGPRPIVQRKRAVLFLKLVDPQPGVTPSDIWIGAGHENRINNSVAWIEGDRLFANWDPIQDQPMALWPAQLWGPPATLANFKRVTLEIVAVRQALAKARAMTDVNQRVAAIEPWLRKTEWYQKSPACVAMAECGPAAVPLLRRMAHEHGQNFNEVTFALAGAAGDNAETELIGVLEDELAYWKRVRPKLAKDWYRSDLPGAQENGLRYTDMRHLLDNLEGHLKDDAPRKVVTELRAMLEPLMPPGDTWSFLLVIKQCDQVLAAMDKKLHVDPAVQAK